MSRNKAKKQSHNARMRLKRANYPKVITSKSLMSPTTPIILDEFGSYIGREGDIDDAIKFWSGNVLEQYRHRPPSRFD